MLAPLVLPFQITAAIFVILWIIGVFVLRKRKQIAVLSVAAILLFIPSCMSIMAIVDWQRYGRRVPLAMAGCLWRAAF